MFVSVEILRVEAFKDGVAALRGAGIENPALDAAVLLGHVTGEPPETVILDRELCLAPSEASRYTDLVRKRCERVAVSRLVGEREFYSRKFHVTEDVLDPRPDTEVLVEHAIRRLKDLDGSPKVLDIGTGSGAIAVSVASEVPSARVTATDISMAALAVARRNAGRHSVLERIHFLQADLLNSFGAGGKFDVILSNPPYISCEQFEELSDEVRCGDPMVALVSGPEGTECYSPIVENSVDLLVPGGCLMLEVGAGQDATVAGTLLRAGYGDVQIIKDLAGTGRVVAGEKNRCPIASS